MRSRRRNMTMNIRDALQEMIFRGELSSGELLASNHELAEQFGVSTLTADRAVRQLVKDGLVYRRQGVGTFIADPKQRKQEQTLRIGVADEKFPSTPLWDSAMGIRARISIQYFYTRQCEVRLLDYQTFCSREKLSEAVAGLDGLLVAAGFIDSVTLENLRELPIPIVITNLEEVLDIPFHQVVWDNDRGIREAAEKIVKNPPEEFLIVYEDHRNGILRKQTMEKQLASLGYDTRGIRSCRVETAALLNGIPSYRLALELSKDIRGKFVFSTSDVVSFSMLEGFREKNLTPGTDFQLLSYDNLEAGGLVPREQEPVLSTIDAPRVRIGERAAELLLDRVGKPMDETVIIKIPTKLVIRKTAFV